jgi:hypothetical protein
VNGQPTSVQFVSDFADLPLDQAESALLLAVDLGFLKVNPAGEYLTNSPLCRFIASSDELQKATALRVLLESYPPFVMFRQRLQVTSAVVDATQQTKVALALSEHHSEIASTMISLGTYSQALSTSGGGRYEVRHTQAENVLERLMEGCDQIAAAEERVAKQLGADAQALVSRDQVVIPLADALRRAQGADARGAVVQAGNAVESFLSELAARHGISLAGKTGINSKIDEIKRNDISKMPSKLSYMGKYLGHVRNAADHGVDPEIHVQWEIRESTGIEYAFVGCSFIAVAVALELGKPPEI